MYNVSNKISRLSSFSVISSKCSKFDCKPLFLQGKYKWWITFATYNRPLPIDSLIPEINEIVLLAERVKMPLAANQSTAASKRNRAIRYLLCWQAFAASMQMPRRNGNKKCAFTREGKDRKFETCCDFSNCCHYSIKIVWNSIQPDARFCASSQGVHPEAFAFLSLSIVDVTFYEMRWINFCEENGWFVAIKFKNNKSPIWTTYTFPKHVSIIHRNIENRPTSVFAGNHALSFFKVGHAYSGYFTTKNELDMIRPYILV